MPVQFLSEAEHKSLNRFPSEVSSEDLNRFFLLSDRELSILKQLRAEHNRLGFALQLCCLRYLGFFPEELHQVRTTWLDGLLEVEPNEKRTRLSWLQRTPTGNNPQQILETLDKISFLQQHQVDAWDLSKLNPNRINYLAKIGARATNQYLQRASEIRRYPILICFLKQSLYNFTDDLKMMPMLITSVSLIIAFDVSPVNFWLH
jgi:hypothetical protein